MRIIILALALIPAAAMARDGDKPAAPARCQSAKTERAAKPALSVRPQTLAQQPMANQYLGVMRLEDGCDRPVMIREGVDGAGNKR
ncbi:MAG: hypothetical protein ABW023_16895 [Sphingomonas sp.]